MNYKGKQVVQGPTTQAMAQSWCPPQVHVYKNEESCQWVLRYKKDTRARAWATHGYHKSLIMVLRWAWKRSLEANGMEVIDCPVWGIFPQRTGDPGEDQVAIDMAQEDTIV